MLDKKFIKFLFVGALNTLFGYLMYTIFISTPLKREWALLCAYIAGVLWNFKTTGSLVFNINNNKLIFKFIASYVFTYFVNLYALIFLSRAGWGEAVANHFLDFFNLTSPIALGKYVDQLFVIFPIAMLSFTIFKFWVFKEQK
ncbi:GtrA family protein [bacterium]|nr:GtrA family protein [bacterium]